MATPLLAGVQDNLPFFKIHIGPTQTIDLPHPTHGLLDGPQIILGPWISQCNNLQDILLDDLVKSLLDRHPGESRGPQHLEITVRLRRTAFAGMTDSMEFRLFTNSSILIHLKV